MGAWPQPTAPLAVVTRTRITVELQGDDASPAGAATSIGSTERIFMGARSLRAGEGLDGYLGVAPAARSSARATWGEGPMALTISWTVPSGPRKKVTLRAKPRNPKTP